MRVILFFLAAIAAFAQPKITLNPFTGKLQFLDNSVAGCNVDLSTAPATNGHVLTYSTGTGTCVWAAPPGAGGGEANTASNVGAAGIGVFHQKTGTDLEFRKLNVGSTKVTLTQADTNRQIVIDVDPTQFSLDTIGAAGTSLPVNRLAAQTASRAIVSDASGFITASAVTAAELAYVSGVTSSIQTQLGGKQAADADLSAIAALGTLGVLARVNSDTWATRTMTGSNNEVCLSDGGGIIGNPTFSICPTVDLTGKTATRPVKAGTTPPPTCSDNDLFIDTDASATQALLYCRSNTWYAQGTGGTAAWGSISGTLSSQTDLQSALDAKAAASHNHAASDVTSGALAAARGGLGADASAFNGVLKMNGAGAASVVSGTGTDCVLVNGTSGPCGAGGASNYQALTDSKVTATSSEITIAAGGAYGKNQTTGLMTHFALSAGTITRTTGNTESGTIRIAKEFNGGTPRYKCYFSTSGGDGTLTASNYSLSGAVCASGDAFLANDIPLATVAVSSGNISTSPTDLRRETAFWVYTAGAGLNQDGGVFSVNSAVVPFLAGATTGMPFGSVASDPSAPNNGECWYDTAQARFECRQNGSTVAMIGGSATWGGITGTLSSQTDLQSALDAKLPLAGGTMTGQLIADNLGVEFEESDTNPTCAAGNFNIYADLSENKLKKCQNGTTTDLDTGGTPGGSNAQVQYNSSGSFGAEAAFTYDASTNTLGLGEAVSGNVSSLIAQSNSSALAFGGRVEFRQCIDNSFPNCTILERNYVSNYNNSTNQVVTRLNHWDGSGVRQIWGYGQNTRYLNFGGTTTGLFQIDLNTGAGLIVRYGDQNTAGRGVAAILAAPTELTSQTGNVAAQTLLAASHTAGMYRVCGFVAITTAGTGSTAAWTLSWRSPASGTDLTHNLFWSSGAAETDTFSVASANEFNVCKVIRSTGASAISLDPGDMNTAVYDTAWTVERLR